MLTAHEPQVEVPPDDELGEAMLALTRPQRAFVVALLTSGSQSRTQAAILAGYGDTATSRRVTAYRLMRNPLVLAAIREEADRRLRGGAALASAKLIELIENGDPKIAFKASVEVLNRAGMIVTTQHKVTVEDTRDRAQMEEEITAMFRRAVDARQLPALAAPIDGEFSEVDANDISDLMVPNG